MMSRYIAQDEVFSGSMRAEPRVSAVQHSVSWYAQDWEVSSQSRRWPVTVAWCAVVLLALWVVGATGYIIFHDDLVKNVVRDRVRMQTAYEDRITRLRSEVDTINSRLMLNQDAFDAKLEALRRRQTLLEDRQGKLSQLGDLSRHPALNAAERELARAASAADDSDQEALPGNEIRLTFASRNDTPAVARPAAAALSALGLPQNARNEAEHALIRLAESQHSLESEQNETLRALQSRAEAARKLVSRAIVDLGFDVEDISTSSATTASTISSQPAPLGGPFVPMVLTGSSQHSPFDEQVEQVRNQLDETAAMFDGLMSLPVRRPVSYVHDITSGFGMRTDPFLGTPAMHAGIDFRADSGTPVRATASGRIVSAGRNGGYGNMVDIEHEGGIVTRYAHMSSIAVAEGEYVQAGDVVGRVGSTGRSTGPHLHYEARLNGDPVNPIRFIRAGDTFLQH